MLGKSVTERTVLMINISEFKRVLLNEARAVNSAYSSLVDNEAWFNALLVNQPNSQKLQRKLAWYYDTDEEYALLMKKFYGDAYRTPLPRLLTIQAARLATKFLSQRLSKRQREFLTPTVASPDMLTLNVDRVRLITLSNHFRYRVALQLNLPRPLTRSATGKVEIPLFWHQRQFKLAQEYGNVTVLVLSGYDTTAKYFWTIRRDYVQQVMQSRLQAYQYYKQVYDDKPFYQKWFKQPLTIDKWEQNNQYRLIKGNQLDNLSDPRVVDFLDHDQISEEELMINLERDIQEMEQAFNACWHDCLQFPAIKFHSAHMKVKTK